MTFKEKAEIGLLELRVIGLTYKVRIYQDRLAIWRQDGKRLTWEEVQEVKQMVWGDLIAVEVYPPQSDVINKRHTRHLWSTHDLRSTVLKDCIHEEFRRTPNQVT